MEPGSKLSSNETRKATHNSYVSPSVLLLSKHSDLFQVNNQEKQGRS